MENLMCLVTKCDLWRELKELSLDVFTPGSIREVLSDTRRAIPLWLGSFGHVSSVPYNPGAVLCSENTPNPTTETTK